MDAFIADHLKGVSRTYAIVIPMLPRGLDEAVGLAYLLMRIVDTLEDAPQIDDAQRRALLDDLERKLARTAVDEVSDPPPAAMRTATPAPMLTATLGELSSERDLMRDAPEVLRRIGDVDPLYRNAARTCARKMIAGVRRMLDRSRARSLPYPAIRDSAELREYCYYVAGVVGEMLCTMMAHFLKAPKLKQLDSVAVELGIGLQLVNILKDALKDSKDGRRYLPIAESGSVAHAEVYKAVLHEARASLARGAEFVLALPATAWQLRSFCGLPIAWGAMTLARAERNSSAAKIGRSAIQASITRFANLARDDHALRTWLLGLLHAPQPNI